MARLTLHPKDLDMDIYFDKVMDFVYRSPQYIHVVAVATLKQGHRLHRLLTTAGRQVIMYQSGPNDEDSVPVMNNGSEVIDAINNGKQGLVVIAPVQLISGGGFKLRPNYRLAISCTQRVTGMTEERLRGICQHHTAVMYLNPDNVKTDTFPKATAPKLWSTVTHRSPFGRYFGTVLECIINSDKLTHLVATKSEREVKLLAETLRRFDCNVIKVRHYGQREPDDWVNPNVVNTLMRGTVEGTVFIGTFSMWHISAKRFEPLKPIAISCTTAIGEPTAIQLRNRVASSDLNMFLAFTDTHRYADEGYEKFVAYTGRAEGGPDVDTE